MGRSLILLLLGVTSALCQTTPPPTSMPGDLETVLMARGGYSAILSLLRSSGILDTLKNAPAITLFAPTDAAIAMIPQAELDAVAADPVRLNDLLMYHAALEDVEELHMRRIQRAQDMVVTSANNKPIRINVYRLVHVLAAEGVNVSDPAIHVRNGYVHGIDGVMMPPTGDAVQIAQKTPELSTLVSLLSSAGLADDIKADMNITVFAPTNDAFAKVSPAIMQYLADHDDVLQEVLLYHVVPSMTLYSIGMRHTMTFHSGDKRHDNLMVLEDFASGDININTAKILMKDISATNGVVHTIDEVLIPARVILQIENAGITIG